MEPYGVWQTKRYDEHDCQRNEAAVNSRPSDSRGASAVSPFSAVSLDPLPCLVFFLLSPLLIGELVCTLTFKALLGHDRCARHD